MKTRSPRPWPDDFPFSASFLRQSPTLLGGFLLIAFLFPEAAARAASYPAGTGSQAFSYGTGVVTGSASWNDGSSLAGSTTGDPAVPVASVQASSLRLTADGVFNTVSSFKLPEIDPGQDISGLTLNFTLKLKAAAKAGQGMTVSFGDIPLDNGAAELGFSLPKGLEVSFTTFVDTAEGQTQGEIVVYANRVKVASYPKTFNYDDNFRAVSIQWTAANGLNLTYDGTALATNLAVPGFVPGLGDRVAFTAGTGEAAAQETAIDNLRVVTTPAATISTGGPVISEFIADNGNSYEDEDLDASDWIEIFNGSASAVPMSGWYLTDDPALLTKWTLPAFTLNANAYRVIFASSKNRTVAAGSLHTNFSLSKSTGYLALVRPDKTIASEFNYGAQNKDTAYGEVGSSRTRGYLETPTPGTKNISVVAEGAPAEEVIFSQGGGLLSNATPVTLSIAAPLAPGAVVRYSTNQTPPTELSPVYTQPFSITNTTTVRARVFEPGKLPGPVNSRTYLKLDSTLTNYNGSGQIFSSNIPVIIFDSFGVAVDSTTDPAAARPFRPTYAVTIAPDPSTGRARLDGPVDYRGRSATHVRGESSSGFDQKSYAWETWNERDGDKDESILGMPPESDWVLHGPFSDKTMMRNHIMYSSFRDARGDWVAPRTRFVEVFFNQQANQPVSYSDYKGVYLLVEKIKRNSNRLNVSKLNPLVTVSQAAAAPGQANVSGGFIFKKDKPSLGSTGWTTGTNAVPLQSVDPDTFPTAQLTAIRNYVNSFETALGSASFANPITGYKAWIDVDSFIDWQLAVEMSKQIDGYVFSTYFHKDRNGKMRAGPMWDFNISLGNANYGEGEYSTGWDYDASRTAALTGQLWFTKLLTDPNYKVATFDRYWELRRGVWSTEAILARIDAVSELLRDGNPVDVTNTTALANISPIARHFRRYPILGVYYWPNPSSTTTRKTFQSEVAYMKTWITERLNWIDNQYGILSTSSRPPVMTRTEGAGGSAQITLAPFAGTVQGANFPGGQLYYTTDGSDPRPADYKLPTSSTFTVLAEYGTASWLVPTAANGGTTQSMESWTGLAEPPNAASWTTGTLGVGFETQTSSSSNPFKYYMSGSHSNDNTWTGGTSNLESAMLNVSSTAYLRVPFALTADQRARIARLQLKVRYDDGFIVYVNGVEAGRQNIKADTAAAWNTVADAVPTNFTDSLGATGVTLDISNAIQNLQSGSNMLAILAVNKTAADNDFLCSPSLLGGLAIKPSGTPPAITSNAYTAPFTVASTAKVKARLFSPDTGLWSPITSSTYVVGAQPATKENLVISEINYAPQAPTPAEITAAGFAAEAADFEFIEFLNTSGDSVDLTNVRLSGAVDEFNFTKGVTPAPVIPPGGRVVLCGSSAAFHARYGNDPNVKVAGEFSGNLNNAGEMIQLVDKDGAVLWSFTYSDKSPWPKITDGLGSSILLNNPARHPAPDPSLGSNWRASAAANGAPGLADSVPFTGTPTADSDGDGTPDLLEYMFGSNPADSSSTLGPRVVVIPGAAGAPATMRLEIPRSGSAEGFDWKVEVSADLSSWAATGQTLSGSQRDNSGRVWEQWSSPLPAGASGQRLFYRIVATKP